MNRLSVVALFSVLAVATGCGGRAPESTGNKSPASAPPGPRVYVSDEPGGRMVIIDPAAGTVVGSLAVGKRPRGIRVLNDGQHVLVALSGSPIAGPGVDESKLPPGDRKADGIGVVDVGKMDVVRVLKSGQDPETFALSPDEKTLYVSNEETSAMSAVDVASGRGARRDAGRRGARRRRGPARRPGGLRHQRRHRQHRRRRSGDPQGARRG